MTISERRKNLSNSIISHYVIDVARAIVASHKKEVQNVQIALYSPVDLIEATNKQMVREMGEEVYARLCHATGIHAISVEYTEDHQDGARLLRHRATIAPLIRVELGDKVQALIDSCTGLLEDVDACLLPGRNRCP